MANIGRGLGWLLANLERTAWDEEDPTVPETDYVSLDDRTWLVSEQNFREEETYSNERPDAVWESFGLWLIPLMLVGSSAVYAGAVWLRRRCHPNDMARMSAVWRGLRQILFPRGWQPVTNHGGDNDGGANNLQTIVLGMNYDGESMPSCPPLDEDLEDSGSEMFEDASSCQLEVADDGWSHKADQGSQCGDIDYHDMTVAECMIEAGEVVVHLLDGHEHPQEGAPLPGGPAPDQPGLNKSSLLKEKISSEVSQFDISGNTTVMEAAAELREVQEPNKADFNTSAPPLSSTLAEVDKTGADPNRLTEKRGRREMQGLDITNVIGDAKAGVTTRSKKLSKP